jgi:outer membrane protein
MLSGRATFIIPLVLVCAVGASAVLFFYKRMPKTAFVNTNQLYDGFELKKELEKKYNLTENARKAILDSLHNNLQLLSNQTRNSKSANRKLIEQYSSSEENFYAVRTRFEDENELLRDKYTEEIWNRINLYVKEYGERNGYTYIYGANGEGNLMYASNAEDITEEVKEYINKRYNGDLK